MINHVVRYFVLNRRERNGLVALLFFIGILLAVKFYLVYFNIHATEPPVLVNLEKAAAAIADNQKQSPNNFSNNYYSVPAKDSLFYFDPNTVKEEQAVKLGFSPKLAHTLINYRSKGGKFYKAESLKKLYGMRDELYDKIAPYVVLGNKNQAFQDDKKENKKTTPQYTKIEINTADSTQWMQFKGIKGGRARLIQKYKSLLGGFYSIEQIKEVYTFNDTLYNSIKDYLTVDPSHIQKLKVNTVDFKTMVHHPYIKYEGTKCIFALKRNKKMVADDLINSSCFSREQLDKVLNYLDFSE